DLEQTAFVLAQLCREVHDPSTESDLVGALITSSRRHGASREQNQRRYSKPRGELLQRLGNHLRAEQKGRASSAG
ncbi:hypothetical protein ACFZC5_08960, partial [Nocardia gamkensis]|uniref:hypothetical protein n=1 Tax=Nocardia gamkensis TaxID=352869 RepID=UPI0036EE8D5C